MSGGEGEKAGYRGWSICGEIDALLEWLEVW